MEQLAIGLGLWGLVGLAVGGWLMRQADIYWVVGMRYQTRRHCLYGAGITGVVALYMAATPSVLWIGHSLLIYGYSTPVPTLPLWLWEVSTVLGLGTYALIVRMAYLNYKTWVLVEERGLR